MLQRKQTIFLFLAAAAFFALLELPFASSEKVTAGIFSDQLYDVMDHSFLLILVGLGGILALVSIFMFKNRRVQLKIGYFLIIISILVPIIAYVLMMNEPESLGSTRINDEFGAYLPFIALVMAGLANFFIKKDDKLVKSMDRLR